jgi:hypothetical protein
MNRFSALTLVAVCAGATSSYTQQAPSGLTGRVSDSICGASHRAKALDISDRLCLFRCLKALAKWVIVDDNNNVFLIANQDLPGLPLYAGRPVRASGEVTGNTIVASRIEAYPPHLHLGHVMTNWRDTPGGVGLLMAALSDGRVAAVHAELAARNPDNLDDMKLHAGHALHAIDPGIEAKGPGSGYGLRRAAAGARQHLELAVRAEGASANVTDRAIHVVAALDDAARSTEEAVVVAQRILQAATPAEGAGLVTQLRTLAARSLESLEQAQAHMSLMMKSEGLENAPR